jgi:tRNA-splicing ligase RtcB
VSAGPNYEIVAKEAVPVKAWIKGVFLEDEAKDQLRKTAKLPFIYKHIAVMPDAHVGKGSTVGSVIPTVGAIIPAAVGVDIGCGMTAVRTGLTTEKLPDNLRSLRDAIESAVPHGRTDNGGANDKGAWGTPPTDVLKVWRELKNDYDLICAKHPAIGKGKVNNVTHLGTLGTGNHFIEMCRDEEERLWIVLHSGSRGIGNRIGMHFIGLAQDDMKRHIADLPDRDLAYLKEGSEHFDDYVQAVSWAQRFAFENRALMMNNIMHALGLLLPGVDAREEVISCHHNYIAQENHFGERVWVTRKGAVRAQQNDLGIIPGSMGIGSFIVRGKGNPQSFNSCSHGAGRCMSRTQARKKISLEQHIRDTAGIECRKDAEVVDESPRAYKPLQSVMEAQSDLVEPLHRLQTLLCVKG